MAKTIEIAGNDEITQILGKSMLQILEKRVSKPLMSPCRPPVNTTYLVIGQDLFSIDEYVKSQYNYSIHRKIYEFSAYEENNSTMTPESTIAKFVPAAFMVYTDLATLNGLWEPTDYGSGIEYADGILDLFPLHEYGDKSSIGLQVSLFQHMCILVFPYFFIVSRT